jgi:hypothetical protein
MNSKPAAARRPAANASVHLLSLLPVFVAFVSAAVLVAA